MQSHLQQLVAAVHSSSHAETGIGECVIYLEQATTAT